VASVAAYSPLPGLSVYAASKAFLRSLSLSQNSEMKAKVDVMTLCPGSVTTPLINNSSPIDAATPSHVVERTLANLGWSEELNPNLMHAIFTRVIIMGTGLHMKFYLFGAHIYMKLFKKMTKFD
jgi:short-subunit dehydrogenase